MFLSSLQTSFSARQQQSDGTADRFASQNDVSVSPLRRSPWWQVAILTSFSILSSTPAAAQSETAPSFLVLGMGATPEYEGADAYQAVPLIVARQQIGSALLEINGTQARLGILRGERFIVGPVLSFTGARDDEVDEEQVSRLEPNDMSFEAGAFAAWRSPFGNQSEGQLELTATASTSAGGDWEGTELALVSEYSWAATSIWRLALGTSLSVTDNDYADSRFGVSPRDADASGLAAYDPAGGLKEVSVSVRSILSFSRRYGMFTRLAYTRLLGDAADSPIVDQAGSIDQAFVGVGLLVSFGR